MTGPLAAENAHQAPQVGQDGRELLRLEARRVREVAPDVAPGQWLDEVDWISSSYACGSTIAVMSTRSLSPLRRMLGRISAVSSSQYSSSGSFASNEPTTSTAPGRRSDPRPTSRSVSSGWSSHVADRQADPLRGPRPTARPEDGDLGRLLLGVRRRDGDLARGIGRRAAIDEADVAGDVLLDPQPEKPGSTVSSSTVQRIVSAR